MARIAKLGVVIDASGAKKGADEASGAIDRVGSAADRAAKQLKQAAAALGVAGIGFGFIDAARKAQDFEKQMALVSTVVADGQASMRVFGKQVLDIFSNLPVESTAELTRGLYDIISAGIPAGQAMEFLNVSARAAIAGVASTGVAVDALTSVVNSYRLTGLSVTDASDKFFKAIQLGKTDFDQLGSTIGRVTPLTAAFGISLDDVLAATAALTAGGIVTAEAITGIRSAIVNIIRPTADFTNRFPELAAEFNTTKLQGVGFIEFLREFRERSNGSSEALNALFTDVQGKTAVLSLLTDGGLKAADMLKQIRESAGASDDAFNKATATSAALSQQLRNALTRAVIELGSTALPTLNIATEKLIELVLFAKDNVAVLAGVLAAGAVAMTGMAVASAVAKGALSAMAAGQTILSIISLARAIRTAADAMALMQLVGLGAAKAALAIASLAAGFIAYKATTAGIAKDTAAFNAELEALAKNAQDAATATGAPGVPEPGTGGGTAGVVDNEAVERAKQLVAANQDRVRLAQQAFDLVGKETDAAARLRIEQQETNALIEAQRDLTGDQLDAAVRAITLEKQWNIAALEGEGIAKRRKALAESTERAADTARATEQLRAQVAALSQSVPLYERVLLTQAQDNAVREESNRLKAAGLTLGENEAATIRAQVAESERLRKVREAMLSLNGENPFKIPDNSIDNIGKLAEGMSRAVSAAQGLASAFGEVGRTVGAALGQTSQLLTNLSRAQQAGVFTNAKGKKQDVGFTGALSGKAGVDGFAAATSSALGFIGAGVALADALDLFGTRAKERARQMAEAAIQFNNALDEFALTAGTALDDALQSNIAKARELAAGAQAASGLTGTLPNFQTSGDILAFLATFDAALATLPERFRSPELQTFSERLREVGTIAAENERILAERNAKDLAQATEDAQVRLLVAQGRDVEAEAMRRQLDLQRATEEALAKYGDAGADYVQLLRDIAAADEALAAERRAAAEAAKATAEAEAALRKARDGAAFLSNLAAREASLAGDDRGAFVLEQTAAAEAQLNAARDLVTSGTITEDAFRRLEAVLSGELAEAIAEYDASLQREAEAKAQAAQAEAEASAARASAQTLDITRRMIAAYEVLNPELAKQLAAEVQAIERAQQLADAENDVVRARLEELFVLEDQAEATRALVEAQEAALRAAQELADFTADINDQYLRVTGRGFDADKLNLDTWLKEQIKQATASGASADTIAQIYAIYDARLAALIADTIETAIDTVTDADAEAARRGDTTSSASRTGVQTISEGTGMRLADIALSQLVELRGINRKTTGAGGVTIQVVLPQGMTMRGTPAELGREIAAAVAPMVDDNLGRRVGVDRRLTGNVTL